ncbi:MAG TPA: ribbon-helix-helix protein, CopG family [Armatimonadota bacterium]|nr:ribbon-helix-helix protein, CopG family [Armatimonadota bacterium]
MRRNRKVPFNCYLSVDQMDELDRVSELERRPRAEIVREAVARYLSDRSEGEAREEEQPQSANAATPEPVGSAKPVGGGVKGEAYRHSRKPRRGS